MDIIFHDFLIKGNEVIFYSFVALMIAIIVTTFILVIKEIKNVYK